MINKKVILAILFGVIISLALSKLIDKKDDDLLYKHSFISKTNTDEKFKIIIAGDSRTYRGISPQEISKNLKYEALNLGYSSAGFSELIFKIINEKLDTSSKTKIIILGITPWSLTPEANKNEHLTQELSRKHEEILADKYFFKIKNSFPALSPKFIFNKFIINKYHNNYQQEYMPNGWIASWYLEQNKYLALEDYVKTFKNNTVSKDIINNLNNQVKIWTSKGIKVYGFFPPSSFDMEVLENNLSGFSRTNFINEFINSGGLWLNVSKNYTSYDGSHLEKNSAIKLSNEIAKLILANTVNNKYNNNLNNYFGKVTDSEFYVNFNDSSKLNNLIYIDSNFVNFADSINPYSFTFIRKISDFKKYPKKITITSNIMIESEKTNAKLICSLDDKKTNIFYKKLQINFIKPKKWNKIEFSINIPKNLPKNQELKIYYWNPNKSKIYINNINISIYN